MCERTISNLDRLKMTVKSPNSVAYFKLETTVSAVYCLILLGGNSYKFLSENSRFTGEQTEAPEKNNLSKVTPSVSDQVRQKPNGSNIMDNSAASLTTLFFNPLLSQLHPSFLDEVVLSNGPSLLLSGIRLVNPHTNH